MAFFLGEVSSDGYWAGRKTTYTYNANGQVISTQRPDGSEETRTYDANGQLLSSANRGADGNLLTSYAFSYDGQEMSSPRPVAYRAQHRLK